MASPLAPNRPFVVLLGWLGCQPKHLRRYEALYKGFEIYSRIASPAQVIRATLTQPTNETLHAPLTWPNIPPVSSNAFFTSPTIEDFAWDILAEMEASEAPVFFLHIFSNGGGFVWEALARILANSHKFPGPVCKRLLSIENRIAGVIVDSAPSLDFSRLPQAVAWVSWRDQLATLLRADPAWFYRWWWNWNSPATKAWMKQRSDTYWHVWTENPVTVRLPMLFLYSENDTLCSPQAIGQIIQTLPNARGICWKESIHCGHLLRHQDEYEDAVQHFIQTHLEKPDMVRRSKL